MDFEIAKPKINVTGAPPAPEEISGFDGFLNSITDWDKEDIPYIGSGIEAVELVKIAKAANRFEKGERNEDDVRLLQGYFDKADKEALLNENKGYAVGETVKTSLRFMGELAAIAVTEIGTGSIAPTGDAYVLSMIAKMGAKKTLEKMAKDKVFKSLVKTAVKNTLKKEAALVTKQFALTAPTNVTGTAAERMIGRYDLKTGEVLDEGQEIEEATVNGISQHAVELITERGGGVTGKMLGTITGPLKKIMVKSSIYRALQKVLPKATNNQLSVFLNKTGWNGTMSEFWEERDADVANDILEKMGLGDQNFEGLTLDQVTTELIAFSIMGGGINIAQRAAPEIKKAIDSEEGFAKIPTVDQNKSVGELFDSMSEVDKKIANQGPGHQKFTKYLNTAVQNGTFLPEEAVILETIFEDTDDVIFSQLSLEENGRLTRSLGRYNPGRQRLQIQKGLAENNEDTGRFASQTFAHEFGHAGYDLVLTEEERETAKEIFDNIHYSDRKGLFTENEQYYAANVHEFFAQSLSDYIFENKVPSQQMEPLLKRVAQVFFDKIKKLVSRKQSDAVKIMKPLFEKILAGDPTTPLSEFANKEPKTFKNDLREMLKLAPQVEAVTKKIKEPEPAPVPEDLSFPPTGDAPIDPMVDIYKKGTQGLPPDIASTIEPPVAVVAGDKKTPIQERVRWIDYMRTPWKVFDRMGIRPEYQKLLKGYEAYVDELPQNIDQITAWSKRVPKESNERIFLALDGEKIALAPEEAQVASEIKTWLSQWADRLGMSKDARISEYITHIFPIKAGGEIPEEIAHIINKKIPGSVYDPFLLQRQGAEGYLKDTWAALDAYTKRATRKVHMDPALKSLKIASDQLTDTSQLNYLNKYTGTINLRPTELDTAIDNHIKEKFGFMFGARPTASITRFFRKMISRAKIGGSVTSFAKNLTQGVNTFSELGTHYTSKGYMDLVKFGGKELEEKGVLIAPFIEDRTYSAVKKMAEKFDTVLFTNMNASELVNRGAAYYGAKAKYLSGKITAKEYRSAFGKDLPANYTTTMEDAIDYGKYVASKTQFKFGPLDTPVGMSSDIAKMAMQFQTFGLKQAEFVGAMVGNKEWKKLARYMISSMFLFQYIAGAFGMKWDDSFKTLRWGMPPAIQFMTDLWKGGIMGEDKYGNKLDPKQRANVVGKSLFTNVVPMGAQAARTKQGFQTVNQGASRNKSGKFEYKVDKTPLNYIRGSLFGKYNLPESKAYYKKKEDKKKGKKGGGGNPFNPQ